MILEHTIIIADRNRNIRDFLYRELFSDGYNVLLAGDQSELFRLLDSEEEADLVVLDMDLPAFDGIETLLQIQSREPSVPVIIHTIYTEYMRHPTVMKAEAFVRKQGNPGQLKMVISEVLRKHYGHKLSLAEDDGAQ